MVNAGNATISCMALNTDLSLSPTSILATGGEFPNSVAVNASRLVYVSNVNRPDNPFNPGGLAPATILGFRTDSQGTLSLVQNSMRTLSTPASLPTQVLFDPSGRFLLVAELFAKTIAVYPVQPDGTLGTPSLLVTEADVFGLVFVGDEVIVSADVSPPTTLGLGSASSFRFNSDGTLTPLTQAVGNGKTAPAGPPSLPTHASSTRPTSTMETSASSS